MVDSNFNKMYQFLVEVRSSSWPMNAPKDLICVSCEKILINACQMVCGCRLCTECVDKLFATSSNRKCPGESKGCREAVSNNRSTIQQDFRANRQISMINVQCPVKDCQFTCKLIEMGEHYRLCSKTKCPFSTWGCKSEFTNIDDHMRSENIKHFKMIINNQDSLQNEISKLQKTPVKNSTENEKLKAMLIKMENLKKLGKQFPSSKDVPEIDEKITNFKWKIKEVTDLRKSRKYMWSEYFFSRFGFEMILLLYPNGYGEMVGKGLTLYLYVSGTNNVKWPFNAEVIISIVNRENPNYRLTERKRCAIFYSIFNKYTEPFHFLYEDLDSKSVIHKNSFIIQCSVNEA